jgi:hypothetical protein
MQLGSFTAGVTEIALASERARDFLLKNEYLTAMLKAETHGFKPLSRTLQAGCLRGGIGDITQVEVARNAGGSMTDNVYL